MLGNSYGDILCITNIIHVVNLRVKNIDIKHDLKFSSKKKGFGFITKSQNGATTSTKFKKMQAEKPKIAISFFSFKNHVR